VALANTFININVGGSTPPYARFILNKPASGQVYNVITAGSVSPVLSSYSLALLRTTGTDLYDWCTYCDIAIDLSDYLFLLPNITNATLQFSGCSYAQASVIWYPTTIGIAGQRETVRGVNFSTANYYEIYNGAFGGTEMSSTSIPLTSFSGTCAFALNASGISYLKSVGSKANNPGYAFFSVLFGEQIDGTPPSTPLSGAGSEFTFTNGQLFLFYDDTATPSTGLNISDVFKQTLAGKINISNTWKTISGIKINVGDVWKDVI